MNVFYTFMLTFIAFALLNLFSIKKDNKIPCIIATVIFIALSIVSYKLGRWKDHKDYINNTKTYETKVKNKQYFEQLIKIKGIFNNKVYVDDNTPNDWDDNYYYINKDSDIKNFDNFKLDDRVDVYCLKDADGKNIIIKVNKLN